MAKTRTVNLFKPFPLQKDILDSKSRFKTLACGRRFSKSSIGKMVIVDVALMQQDEVYWVAPTFKTSSNVWRDLKSTFSDVIEWKSEQERTVGLVGGGIFTVWSAQNYDSIRGNNPKSVILDEAAMMNPDIWDAVVRPALSDKKGTAYFLSTPRGRNFFYDLFEMGNSDSFEHRNYESWRYPSWYNPYVYKSEFVDAKMTLHDKLFRQEYMAEFLLDASDVFKGVSEVCILEESMPYNGHFVFGVDIGRVHDPTVITIWDKEKKHLVKYISKVGMDFPSQKKLIEETYQSWNSTGHVSRITVENNYAPSFVEDLTRTSMPIKPFRTGNENKSEIINKLASDIQSKKVSMVNDKELLFEFQAFTMTILPSGKPKYAAPAGYHDDIVLSSALGYVGVNRGVVGGRSLSKSLFERN